MLSLILDPIGLMAILWLVARHNADFEFSTVFFVTLGLTLATFLIALAIGIFAVIPLFGLCVWALMKFCYTTLGQALIATTIFVAYKIGYGLLLFR